MGGAVAHADDGHAVVASVNALTVDAVACHLVSIVVTYLGDGALHQGVDTEGGAQRLLLPVARLVCA